MNKFLVLIVTLVVVFSCKEKPMFSVYSASCVSKVDSSQVDIKLFLSDTSVVLIQGKQDPYVWSLKSKDGEMRTKINYQDLTIDFGNKDSIVGTLYKEAMRFDTTLTLDPASMAESMTIDTIIDLQIVSTCSFKPDSK
jgi:hypothetical protein